MKTATGLQCEHFVRLAPNQHSDPATPPVRCHQVNFDNAFGRRLVLDVFGFARDPHLLSGLGDGRQDFGCALLGHLIIAVDHAGCWYRAGMQPQCRAVHASERRAKQATTDARSLILAMTVESHDGCLSSPHPDAAAQASRPQGWQRPQCRPQLLGSLPRFRLVLFERNAP
jgi:hypothetical protein